MKNNTCPTWARVVLGLSFAAVFSVSVYQRDVAIKQRDEAIADALKIPKLRFATDNDTGCQYVVSTYGGITPRIDQDAMPVCGDL